MIQDNILEHPKTMENSTPNEENKGNEQTAPNNTQNKSIDLEQKIKGNVGPIPFTNDEYNQIFKDTLTQDKTKVDTLNKFATDKQISDVCKTAKTPSHAITALKLLNVENYKEKYIDNKIKPGLPDVQPKNQKPIEHKAKEIATGIEKLNKGLQID